MTQWRLSDNGASCLLQLLSPEPEAAIAVLKDPLCAPVDDTLLLGDTSGRTRNCHNPLLVQNAGSGLRDERALEVARVEVE